jgi:hypothetical protein
VVGWVVEAYFRYLLDVLQSIDYGWTCTIHKIDGGVTMYQHHHYNSLRISHNHPDEMQSVITPMRHNCKRDGGDLQFRAQTTYVNFNGDAYYDHYGLTISLESHEKLVDELTVFLMYNFY